MKAVHISRDFSDGVSESHAMVSALLREPCGFPVNLHEIIKSLKSLKSALSFVTS
jgi:hypothetical protein